MPIDITYIEKYDTHLLPTILSLIEWECKWEELIKSAWLWDIDYYVVHLWTHERVIPNMRYKKLSPFMEYVRDYFYGMKIKSPGERVAHYAEDLHIINIHYATDWEPYSDRLEIELNNEILHFRKQNGIISIHTEMKE